MDHPKLSTLSLRRSMTDAFQGYDNSAVISEKCFSDMKNLSLREYPALSSRKKRGKIGQGTDIKAVLLKGENLCYINGTSLFFGGSVVSGITLTSETPKQMVSMGAYIVIFPDAVYFNTENPSDYGSLNSSYVKPSSAGCTVTVSRQDGSDYENLITDSKEPNSPAVGDYWVDTSATPSVLRMYTYEKQWADVPVSYCTISASGIGSGFEAGDGITLRASADMGGLLRPDGDGYAISAVITAATADSITLQGILNSAQISYAASSGFTLSAERRVPDMDYVIECGNRLWGCKYGIDSVSGETYNEIYASALGDPKNWRVYQGTAADSYTVSLGTDGVFTGAIAYQSRPVFFKENYIHTVYGDYPSNFALNTATTKGIQKGSWKSAAIVGGVLYYKSPSDICAYDGSLPVTVSAQFGENSYKTASAGACGNLYYVSMADKNGDYSMFVYDTVKGMWTKEDSVQAICFSGNSGELYFADSNNGIYAVNGSVGTAESDIDWSFTTGNIGYENPDGKRMCRLTLNMYLEQNCKAYAKIQYDSSGIWHDIAVISGNGKTKITDAVIIPAPCGHFSISVSGTGDMRLVSITKSVLYGGVRK